MGKSCSDLTIGGFWLLLVRLWRLLVLTKENAFFAYVAFAPSSRSVSGKNTDRSRGCFSPPCSSARFSGVTILVNLCGSLRDNDSHLSIARQQSFRSALRDRHRRRAMVPLFDRPLDCQPDRPRPRPRRSLSRFARLIKPPIYFITFIAASYVLMANVRYGMNLRYANMWDMPLRFLGGFCLTNVSDRFGPAARWIFPAARRAALPF